MTVRLLAPQFRASRDQIHVPPDKVRIIPTEGNTNLIRSLQSIVKHFDSDDATSGGGANQHRAVLIITDADVDEVPSAELAALNQRNIVPYMIYINIRDAGGGTESSRRPPDRHDPRVRRRLFRRDGREQLVRAYEAIDELEACASSSRTAPSGRPYFPGCCWSAWRCSSSASRRVFSPSWSGVRIPERRYTARRRGTTGCTTSWRAPRRRMAPRRGGGGGG